MDTISAEARSALMGRIRSKNSTPERVVRSALYASGLRFRVHRKDLPGTPDIAFISARVAIFVHGCFWHQHPQCKLASSPKSNTSYWQDKLRRNVERDAVAMASLRYLGWDVLLIWECETRNAARLRIAIERVIAHVQERKKSRCC